MSSALENSLSNAFLKAKNFRIELKKSEDVFEGLSCNKHIHAKCVFSSQ